MPLVNVTGTFISANLKKSDYEGKVSYAVMIDVYQADSPQTDKMVSIKCEDHEMLKAFQDNYKMGDRVSISCSLTAYKNQAYFKYIDMLPAV